jgi:hypothetical protein
MNALSRFLLVVAHGRRFGFEAAAWVLITTIALSFVPAAVADPLLPGTPVTPPPAVAVDYYGSSCPRTTHYACWYDPYGARFCGCWPGGDYPACPSGFHYDCRPGPTGQLNCACY